MKQIKRRLAVWDVPGFIMRNMQLNIEKKYDIMSFLTTPWVMEEELGKAGDRRRSVGLCVLFC